MAAPPPRRTAARCSRGAGKAVVDDHEDHDDRQAEEAGGEAQLDRIGASVEPIWVTPSTCRSTAGARIDTGGKIHCALLGEVAADERRTAKDRLDRVRVDQELGQVAAAP